MAQRPNSLPKKRFLIYYFVLRLEFSGGYGETHTSGQEAIALALKVISHISNKPSLKEFYAQMTTVHF